MPTYQKYIFFSFRIYSGPELDPDPIFFSFAGSLFSFISIYKCYEVYYHILSVIHYLNNFNGVVYQKFTPTSIVVNDLKWLLFWSPQVSLLSPLLCSQCVRFLSSRIKVTSDPYYGRNILLVPVGRRPPRGPWSSSGGGRSWSYSAGGTASYTKRRNSQLRNAQWYILYIYN